VTENPNGEEWEGEDQEEKRKRKGKDAKGRKASQRCSLGVVHRPSRKGEEKRRRKRKRPKEEAEEKGKKRERTGIRRVKTLKRGEGSRGKKGAEGRGGEQLKKGLTDDTSWAVVHRPSRKSIVACESGSTMVYKKEVEKGQERKDREGNITVA
jgi:hypothetical protein